MDRPASPDEHIFLPDYVFTAYENANIERDGQEMPAIRSTQVLFDSNSFQTPEKMIRPWMVFTILSLIVCLITYRDYRKKLRSRWLDFTLMLLTGLLGCFTLFLWFITSHSTTQ